MVALTLLALGYQGSVNLRYAPPVGKTFRYRMTMGMEMKGMGGPQASNNSFSQDMTMRMRIVGRAAGKTTVETTVEQMKMSVPPGSPMTGMKANLEKQAKGQKTTLVMDARGMPVSGAGAGAAVAQNIGTAMGGVALPNRPVRVGETWSTEIDFGKLMAGSASPMPGLKVSGKAPIKMKLVSASGSTAKISFTMRGTMNMAMQGQNMKFATTLASQGVGTYDVATGLVRDLQSTSTSVTAMGAMKMTQKTTQTMKRL